MPANFTRSYKESCANVLFVEIFLPEIKRNINDRQNHSVNFLTIVTFILGKWTKKMLYVRSLCPEIL